MKYHIIVLLSITTILVSGNLKDDNLPGTDIEIIGNSVRSLTPTATGTHNLTLPQTVIYSHDPSRAETLWVDRLHQYAIAEHVSISANGMFIQAGWWLNYERTSLYRTLATSVPSWSCPMPLAEWYVPVDVSRTADDIAVGGMSEPLYSFSSSSPASKWQYFLPGGFKIATSSQGTTVAVSSDCSVYGVVGSGSGIGKLFILNQLGDTLRTVAFNPNNGIYGLDISDDGALLVHGDNIMQLLVTL